MWNSKRATALGLAGVLALGATTQAMAAPVSGNTVAVKAAAKGDKIDVRWGGWGWGPGLGIGLGLAFAGAALAAPYYAYGCAYPYCGGPYGYAYVPAYRYGPAYAYVPGPHYGWRWRHRHHWHHG